ncbi:hypothetical protein H310_03400 [Aphanomyces invadans]|uniref:Nudix hydrolase domain-containing protein n=1 Tax=Aphanomyces invadans TaxID=157072 RepID=A0A024UHK2_9STRA|nr:hypothetical protein H310_03400 [Aphanomyces invadans]ETW05680.1 hypothetical protein H310_03400 [Aphanomyces invadans]|eukprot:XP_008865457.1 hypothetical protein H310_03400 [Aphanomyces invadans]
MHRPPRRRFNFDRLIRRCNTHDPTLYVPLTVDASEDLPPAVVGLVRKDFVERLRPFHHVFDWSRIHNALHLRSEFSTEPQRTAAMQEVAKALKPETWRGEAYGAVRDDRHSEPWFRIDRSASTFFGISQFGCHLNGYVRDLSHHNTTSVWLGVRSSTKAIHPGKLDTLVGGGLPWDLSPLENMLKEAEEEAGLTLDDLGRAIRSTGALTYRNDERQGFKHNTMFTFDVELPPSWQPVNTDGEVAGFHLWPMDDVLELLQSQPDEFKPDVCLVLLDFAIRQGHLSSADFESPVAYARLCSSLHSWSCHKI